MSDDHASKAVSAYNTELIETPNIDRIGREGMIFTNAFVTNSICAPSRAVILTGKFSHVNGVTDNSRVFNGDQPTFPKILHQNGYQTALIGKWHLKSAPTGFDYWNVLPGQGDYYNPDFIKLGKDTIYGGYVTDIITDLSLNWLNERDKNKPFCLMVHHKAPHRSWIPALKNLELFDNKDFHLPDNFYDDYKNRDALKEQMLTVKHHMDIRMDFKIPCEECDTASVNSWAPGEYLRRLNRLTPGQLQKWEESYRKEEKEFHDVKNDEAKLDHWKFRRYLEDYLRCIVSVDESVGKILDFLRQNGLEKNTLIIYTSDQGFFLGEHGLFDKRFMYEESLKIPLLIRFPEEIKENWQSDQLVQNLDIAPTILDVAGLTIPEEMQGISLRTLWQEDNPVWRESIYYHYYEKGFGATPHYGIRTKRYKLIHFYDVVDSWEFYDLDADPNEMINSYQDGSNEKTIKKLKSELIELQSEYKISEE
jgi:arylsulfatase A-like enzyme